jgi:hypothetical protein
VIRAESQITIQIVYIDVMLTLKCRSKLWLYPGPGGWHFITLPQKQAKTIKALAGPRRHGWGAVPVTVTIGKTTWKTSIFPEKKSASYVLPVKAGVREKEKLGEGDVAAITLEINT